MNIQEFDACYRKLMDYWPNNYALIHGKERFMNNTISLLLFNRIGERVSADDFMEGVEAVAANGGRYEPSDIIKAVNDVVNRKARNKKAMKAMKECDLCLGSGFVSTIDIDGYNYVFRCPRSCKTVSTKVPMWDPKYIDEGFRRVVVNGRLAATGGSVTP